MSSDADHPEHTPTPEESPTLKRRRRLPTYHVILMNDDDHTADYIIEMMNVLFGYPPETGHALAEEVDRAGRVVVFTGHREHAELKREQIDAYGSDPRVEDCEGSMKAVVELADDD